MSHRNSRNKTRLRALIGDQMIHLNAKTKISIPELAMVGGTRVILGFGIALLLADRLDAPQRKAVGWALVAIGAVSTIPLAMEILGERQSN